jgi:hypothetical protein
LIPNTVDNVLNRWYDTSGRSQSGWVVNNAVVSWNTLTGALRWTTSNQMNGITTTASSFPTGFNVSSIRTVVMVIRFPSGYSNTSILFQVNDLQAFYVAVNSGSGFFSDNVSFARFVDGSSSVVNLYDGNFHTIIVTNINWNNTFTSSTDKFAIGSYGTPTSFSFGANIQVKAIALYDRNFSQADATVTQEWVTNELFWNLAPMRLPA